MADAHMAPLTPQRVNAVIDVAQRAWDGPGWWPRPDNNGARIVIRAPGMLCIDRNRPEPSESTP
jgi:hypothetical protein